TEREREVLALVGEGLTNRQIGQRLYLAEKTVTPADRQGQRRFTGRTTPARQASTYPASPPET
ncbi:LuxR C-terminal-related transcriptional regulator, partial [Kitasatospora purpeofusca]|uniref:response regulator transcription factor n=1 Tax=Kitasatospora purpeofusca TaxID=67352 RepID=UPI0033DD0978